MEKKKQKGLSSKVKASKVEPPRMTWKEVMNIITGFCFASSFNIHVIKVHSGHVIFRFTWMYSNQPTPKKQKLLENNNKSKKAVWTEDQTDLLKNLVEEGFTAAEIADDELGNLYTKQQIQTKISTLKRNGEVDSIKTDILGPNRNKVSEVLQEQKSPLKFNQDVPTQNETSYDEKISKFSFPSFTYSDGEFFFVFIKMWEDVTMKVVIENFGVRVHWTMNSPSDKVYLESCSSVVPLRDLHTIKDLSGNFMISSREQLESHPKLADKSEVDGFKVLKIMFKRTELEYF